MPDRVIENPIINSPYREPGRHFVFDDDGITDEIADERRRSAYFVPIPRPRKQARQLELVTEWTRDRIKENHQINQIRARVQLWRQRGYPEVTPTTRSLLAYWADSERDNPILFCQREAAETAIYVTEAAPKAGDAWIRNELDAENAEHNNGLPRIGLKMATGTGKTVVMAMLIAWQTLNKVASPQDARFAKHFLIVTPGITIRDRLRVLLPDSPDNYYRLRDLVPADGYGALRRAKIIITNFHAFRRRETKEGRGLGSVSKQILARGVDAPSPFLETAEQMMVRVCREFGMARREIVVLNDEAHHCYRGKVIAEEGADTEETLKGEDRTEAGARNAEARVWFTGLEHIRRKLGIKTVYDLSATPFFLAGSGYREGTLFPWVVSDFSLIDAIESGIVKVPRVPVDDDRTASTVTYLELWREIRDQLPKKGRKDAAVGGPPDLPGKLEGALHSLYGNYKQTFERWQQSGLAEAGETPPVFIIVCNNTNVSKLVFDFVAGWQSGETPEGQPVLEDGLRLFSNVEDGRWAAKPKTILVDSGQLESGEAMSADFKRVAAREIEEFKSEYRQRFPGRSTDALTDEDLLREVMNTVGKKGKLGEVVRCVVSVSMLTEGWDANTVTHILGVRAFGTQLLCEQVVGRALRRRSYAADESGHFEPEYAEVYGVPFSFIPASGTGTDQKQRHTVTRVHADPNRSACEIIFPRLVGYRVELPDGPLYANFGEDSRLVLTGADLPSTTEVAGAVGAGEQHRLDELLKKREQEVAFELARRVLDRHMQDRLGNPRPWLFPRLLKITKSWLREAVAYQHDTFPGLLLISENAHRAAQKIGHAILPQQGDRQEYVLPILRPYDTIGTTADVDFDTTKDSWPTSDDLCHVTHVVCDTGWEGKVAKAIEELRRDVAAYVKNDHLGFTIPYTHLGRTRQYFPDFLIRLRDPGDRLTRTLIVEVSGYKPAAPTEEKAATARNLWVSAVNSHGGFGRWAYLEITNPNMAKANLRAAFQALYEERAGRRDQAMAF